MTNYKYKYGYTVEALEVLLVQSGKISSIDL